MANKSRGPIIIRRLVHLKKSPVYTSSGPLNFIYIYLNNFADQKKIFRFAKYVYVVFFIIRMKREDYVHSRNNNQIR